MDSALVSNLMSSLFYILVKYRQFLLTDINRKSDVSDFLSDVIDTNKAEPAGESQSGMAERPSNQEPGGGPQHSGLEALLSEVHHTVIACCRKLMQSEIDTPIKVQFA